ncbi:MAG: hypothetical protein AAFQ24_03580 [Pseudomonadota bacterium]
MSLRFELVATAVVIQGLFLNSEAASESPKNACSFKLIKPEIGHLPSINVDGAKLYFDTGASATIVSSEYPKGTQVSNDDVIVAQTFGAPLKLLRHVGETRFDLCGTLSVSAFTIAADSEASDPFWGSFQTEASALLGRDALTRIRVEIDRRNGDLKVSPVASAPDQKDRARWPYMVSIQAQGQDFACILDTGFSHRASVFVPRFSTLYDHLATADTLKWSSSHSASASQRVIDVFDETATIEGLAGSGMVFSLEQTDSPGETNDLRRFCVVGSDFLEDAELTLSPLQQFAELHGALPRAGYNQWGVGELLYDQENDLFFVGKLNQKFSAYQSGLRDGDQILAVDGKVFGVGSISTLRERAFAPKGVVTQLDIRRSGARMIVRVINSDPVSHN